MFRLKKEIHDSLFPGRIWRVWNIWHRNNVKMRKFFAWYGDPENYEYAFPLKTNSHGLDS